MTRLAWRPRLRKALSRAIRPVQFWLRRQLLHFVDHLAMIVPVKPEPERVLLVRIDHIGDFVLWLDAARTIAEHYSLQGKQVTLLGNAIWCAWAQDLGIFHRVLPLETERFKRDLRYRFRTGAHLRRQGFGLAVHAASTRVVELGDSLVRVGGALERIGPENPPGVSVSNGWYTRLIPLGTDASGELQRNAGLVRGLLHVPYRARVADLRGMLRRDDSKSLPATLPSGPYFVLFPGASHPGRKWPAVRFVELAERIHDRTGWTGIVCGGPGDTREAAFLVAQAKCSLRDLAGQTDLPQLAAVIAGAQFLIANDTSAIHIAAAMAVPSVCILGGGHFGRFVPYDVEVVDARPLPRFAVHAMPCFGCEWACKFHPHRSQPMPCVEEVTVDAVWREVDGLLSPVEGSSSPFRMLAPHGNPTKDEAEAALVGI